MSNLLCKWTLGLIHVLSVSNLRMSIWTQDVGRVYSCHMIETVQVFEHSRGCPWPPCFANCFNDISVNLEYLHVGSGYWSLIRIIGAAMGHQCFAPYHAGNH